jgi:thioredoxin-like negative regulator of GroEL
VGEGLEALALRPGALIKEGNTDEGLRELAGAVRLDPAYAIARFNLGNALAHAGRTEEGVAQLAALPRDRDPAVGALRLKVVEALGALGPAARSAEPALLELQRRDPEAAEAARVALDRIRARR